jgi:hypothetical protein
MNGTERGNLIMVATLKRMLLRWNLCFTPVLNLTFSPGRRNSNRGFLLFAADRPPNPVARIFKQMENDSPSPWGEGWVEGGRETN